MESQESQLQRQPTLKAIQPPMPSDANGIALVLNDADKRAGLAYEGCPIMEVKYANLAE